MGFGISDTQNTQSEEEFVASNTLRFGPIRQDIEWDGESFAKVTVPARCVNTAATHTVSVVQIFTANQTDPNGSIPYRAGDAVVWRASENFLTPTQSFFLPATITTTGEVSVALTESTGWVFSPTTGAASSIQFPQNFRFTTEPRFFEFRVDQVAGTTKTVLAVGLISRLPVNVFRQSVTVSTGGGTAQQCPS